MKKLIILPLIFKKSQWHANKLMWSSRDTQKTCLLQFINLPRVLELPMPSGKRNTNCWFNVSSEKNCECLNK